MTRKYYKGQTLQIDLVMEVDLTGALTTEIRYRKPNGTEGAWTASVIDAESGWIQYILPAASNDASGKWVVWAYAVQADSSVVIGTPLDITINEPGY